MNWNVSADFALSLAVDLPVFAAVDIERGQPSTAVAVGVDANHMAKIENPGIL